MELSYKIVGERINFEWLILGTDLEDCTCISVLRRHGHLFLGALITIFRCEVRNSFMRLFGFCLIVVGDPHCRALLELCYVSNVKTARYSDKNMKHVGGYFFDRSRDRFWFPDISLKWSGSLGMFFWYQMPSFL